MQKQEQTISRNKKFQIYLKRIYQNTHLICQDVKLVSNNTFQNLVNSTKQIQIQFQNKLRKPRYSQIIINQITKTQKYYSNIGYYLESKIEKLKTNKISESDRFEFMEILRNRKVNVQNSQSIVRFFEYKYNQLHVYYKKVKQQFLNSVQIYIFDEMKLRINKFLNKIHNIDIMIKTYKQMLEPQPQCKILFKKILKIKEGINQLLIIINFIINLNIKSVNALSKIIQNTKQSKYLINKIQQQSIQQINKIKNLKTLTNHLFTKVNSIVKAIIDQTGKIFKFDQLLNQLQIQASYILNKQPQFYNSIQSLKLFKALLSKIDHLQFCDSQVLQSKIIPVQVHCYLTKNIEFVIKIQKQDIIKTLFKIYGTLKDIAFHKIFEIYKHFQYVSNYQDQIVCQALIYDILITHKIQIKQQQYFMLTSILTKLTGIQLKLIQINKQKPEIGTSQFQQKISLIKQLINRHFESTKQLMDLIKHQKVLKQQMEKQIYQYFQISNQKCISILNTSQKIQNCKNTFSIFASEVVLIKANRQYWQNKNAEVQSLLISLKNLYDSNIFQIQNIKIALKSIIQITTHQKLFKKLPYIIQIFEKIKNTEIQLLIKDQSIIFKSNLYQRMTNRLLFYKFRILIFDWNLQQMLNTVESGLLKQEIDSKLNYEIIISIERKKNILSDYLRINSNNKIIKFLQNSLGICSLIISIIQLNKIWVQKMSNIFYASPLYICKLISGLFYLIIITKDQQFSIQKTIQMLDDCLKTLQLQCKQFVILKQQPAYIKNKLIKSRFNKLETVVIKLISDIKIFKNRFCYTTVRSSYIQIFSVFIKDCASYIKQIDCQSFIMVVLDRNDNYIYFYPKSNKLIDIISNLYLDMGLQFKQIPKKLMVQDTNQFWMKKCMTISTISDFYDSIMSYQRLFNNYKAIVKIQIYINLLNLLKLKQKIQNQLPSSNYRASRINNLLKQTTLKVLQNLSNVQSYLFRILSNNLFQQSILHQQPLQSLMRSIFNIKRYIQSLNNFQQVQLNLQDSTQLGNNIFNLLNQINVNLKFVNCIQFYHMECQNINILEVYLSYLKAISFFEFNTFQDLKLIYIIKQGLDYSLNIYRYVRTLIDQKMIIKYYQIKFKKGEVSNEQLNNIKKAEVKLGQIINIFNNDVINNISVYKDVLNELISLQESIYENKIQQLSKSIISIFDIFQINYNIIKQKNSQKLSLISIENNLKYQPLLLYLFFQNYSQVQFNSNQKQSIFHHYIHQTHTTSYIFYLQQFYPNQSINILYPNIIQIIRQFPQLHLFDPHITQIFNTLWLYYYEFNYEQTNDYTKDGASTNTSKPTTISKKKQKIKLQRENYLSEYCKSYLLVVKKKLDEYFELMKQIEKTILKFKIGMVEQLKRMIRILKIEYDNFQKLHLNNETMSSNIHNIGKTIKSSFFIHQKLILYKNLNDQKILFIKQHNNQFNVIKFFSDLFFPNFPKWIQSQSIQQQQLKQYIIIKDNQYQYILQIDINSYMKNNLKKNYLQTMMSKYLQSIYKINQIVTVSYKNKCMIKNIEEQLLKKIKIDAKKAIQIITKVKINRLNQNDENVKFFQKQLQKIETNYSNIVKWVNLIIIQLDQYYIEKSKFTQITQKFQNIKIFLKS